MSNQPQVAPYGSWESPISSDFIVSSGIGFSDPLAHPTDPNVLLWTESRPQESGRCALVYCNLDPQQAGQCESKDVLPPHDSPLGFFSARTRVHEYGGAASLINSKSQVFFTNFKDQSLMKTCLGSISLHEPNVPQKVIPCKPNTRHADGVYDEKRSRLVLVREDHSDDSVALREPQNLIVSLLDVSSSSGVVSSGDDDHAEIILAQGMDFYAFPRLSQDGSHLCYLAWNHPNMQWDNSSVFVVALDEAGKPIETTRKRITQENNESCSQPCFSPDGKYIYFISDYPTTYWTLQRYHLESGRVENLMSHTSKVEIGGPLWTFGTVLFFIGFSPSLPTAMCYLDMEGMKVHVIKESSKLEISHDFLSIPERIEFPTTGNRTAFAYFYPPKNGRFMAPENEKPPCIVFIHGGPTSSVLLALNFKIQYFTSRGFGVLDVDYSGSTGYGREYRFRLHNNWGIADIEDACASVEYLVKKGLADANKLCISGGSAGGYTVLACLTQKQVFKAGASHYGVADLEALAKETHKFEARYLDNLIGEYPKKKHLYIERSPITHVDRLKVPLAIFQGDEDKIVPPNQSEMMYKAVKEKGIPVSYTLFEGEQHGFRKAENIKKAIDGEFYFYSKVFSFPLASSHPQAPITIENLNDL
ncbi:hypothetical protein C9374_010282 [Naegleria lovaniensis]|uniref:Peptidase S9 prolyl oligopeptidase catalytic domain-containing protein n=1 Tax=Naegleria lovaniensis TaxID=51637 RepID=A0AA88GHE3_NAELO|nr:uncharacterized protein C9374_010282 [Naegleria lovaniensis]KAG2374908.1 hypothetical protein C9374_010282 [Naegleria lovaniensis]